MRATKNISAEIIVVDNNSTDGSKIFLCNKFANVLFIWNKENLGFSKANNIAVRQAKGKHILFLNPDTIIAEDCLEKCLTFFEAQINIGALGIRMVDGSGNFLKESKRGFLSPLTSFFKLSGLASMFPASPIFARYYLGHLTQNTNHIVHVLSGAFMMVKKDILDDLGGFDEDFFMYGEDVDLSFRIQKAGYKNYYFSDCTIIHFKGESTKKNSLKQVEIFYGAMVLYVTKHFSSKAAMFYSACINLIIGLKKMGIRSKNIFFGKQNVKEIGPIKLPTLIIANEIDYNYINELLHKAGDAPEILVRWAVSDEATIESRDGIEALAELVNRHTIKSIIFCINELSVKKTIDVMEALKFTVNYSFTMAGSDSIVSGNKNPIINLLPAIKA